MYNVRTVQKDLYWVGGSDRRLALFENVFPIPRGVSYNAYLVLDEKTILMDTVDLSVGRQMFENLEHLLQGRPLDYVVINHMEPDHCATLGELILHYPEVKLVGNAKTMTMIGQFFDFGSEGRTLTVSEGDSLCTGRHTFRFYMAPMVHWPETMVTYDETDKVLFSADAFGTFGALSGSLFSDEVDFENVWLDDARRYYANIVGKYGAQVQTLLKKAAALDIQMICPLHGPVWRSNIPWYIEKYQRWSTYTPEEQGIVIAYASVYGNTQNAAEVLASKLYQRGITRIQLFDVSMTHPSYIVSECFKYSHLAIATTTYNGGIFCNMETLLLDLKAHMLQNRTVAVIENGSWGATAARLTRELLAGMKNMNVLEEGLSLKSSLKDSQLQQLDVLADQLASTLKG